METPLIKSSQSVIFTGKSYNNHPQWSNQPLRLTKEQRKDPLPAFDDFFECFHLKDVREKLWEWVSEIVASPNDLSSNPLERSSHLYFYEKMEIIIEAAFVMKKRLHKRRLQNEKRKLKRKAKEVSIQAKELTEKTNPNKEIQSKISLEPINAFHKEKRLLEYVNENPFYAIREILKPGHRAFITYAIRDWLLIALSTENPSYEDSDHREMLITFQDHLLSFIEALSIILIKNTEEGDFKEQLRRQYQISLLTNDQKADPYVVIIEFFSKYSMVYIQRELEDWHDAAVIYHGPWREDITCAWHVIETYRNVSCLIKAANRLLTLNMIPLK